MDAINKIQDAEKEMQKLNGLKKNRPLRYLQIHRSRLSYYLKMKLLGYSVNQNLLGTYAKKTLDSLKTLPDYALHREEINSIIHRLKIIPYQPPQEIMQL